MRTPPVPNDRLRALLAEADWTGAALARAVNAIGAEIGVSLHYQRASVTHWLCGIRPRPPVPALVEEALSRRLGRTVTAEAVGFTASDSPDGSAASTALAGTSGWRRPRESDVYHLALLAEVGTMPAPARCRPLSGTVKVGRAEVNAATAMVGLFSDVDSGFGGGRARRALSAYLASTVTPWLRATAAPRVRHDLLITAAQLTYLCGFMCFDDELHGTAQRYYLLSAELAAQAADVTAYAIALRALSVQAHLLGQYQQSLHLAEAAVYTAATKIPERTRAFLVGQLGVAHAATGDRHGALTQLLAAERLLEHAASARPASTVGVYHPASLAHQRAVVTACLGDRRTAIAALKTSIRYRPGTERRSRAITLARLAELQLDHGHLEAACGTWHQFLDDYGALQSRRADKALAILIARTLPLQNNPAASALRRRTRRSSS